MNSDQIGDMLDLLAGIDRHDIDLGDNPKAHAIVEAAIAGADPQENAEIARLNDLVVRLEARCVQLEALTEPAFFVEIVTRDGSPVLQYALPGFGGTRSVGKYVCHKIS